MAKAYADDLRRKLLQAYDRKQGSLRGLAERFATTRARRRVAFEYRAVVAGAAEYGAASEKSHSTRKNKTAWKSRRGGSSGGKR